MKKRIFSGFLALVLMLGVVPAWAEYAAECACTPCECFTPVNVNPLDLDRVTHD